MPEFFRTVHDVSGGGEREAMSRFDRRSGICLNGTFFGAGQNGTNRDILTIKKLTSKISFHSIITAQ